MKGRHLPKGHALTPPGYGRVRAEKLLRDPPSWRPRSSLGEPNREKLRTVSVVVLVAVFCLLGLVPALSELVGTYWPGRFSWVNWQ